MEEKAIDAGLRRLHQILSLALLGWVIWDVMGSWRRAKFIAEMQRIGDGLGFVTPPDREPSPTEVSEMLERAEEIKRGGSDGT